MFLVGGCWWCKTCANFLPILIIMVNDPNRLPFFLVRMHGTRRFWWWFLQLVTGRVPRYHGTRLSCWRACDRRFLNTLWLWCLGIRIIPSISGSHNYEVVFKIGASAPPRENVVGLWVLALCQDRHLQRETSAEPAWQIGKAPPKGKMCRSQNHSFSKTTYQVLRILKASLSFPYPHAPCMVYFPTKLGDFLGKCWGSYASTMEHNVGITIINHSPHHHRYLV